MSEGTDYIDTDNLDILDNLLPRIRAKGKEIILYHYSDNALNDPAIEARFFLSAAKPYRQPTDIMALDYEQPGAKNQPFWMKLFLAGIFDGWGRRALYSSTSYLASVGLTWNDTPPLVLKWVADYYPEENGPPTDGPPDLWQFTGSGQLVGITGDVDLSLAYF